MLRPEEVVPWERRVGKWGEETTRVRAVSSGVWGRWGRRSLAMMGVEKGERVARMTAFPEWLERMWRGVRVWVLVGVVGGKGVRVQVRG